MERNLPFRKRDQVIVTQGRVDIIFCSPISVAVPSNEPPRGDMRQQGDQEFLVGIRVPVAVENR